MRILNVAPNAEQLTQTVRLLADDDVVGTASMDDALEALGDPTFDVVLLTLRMPGYVGLDALRAVMDAAGRTPVLVIGGMEDGQLVREAIRYGAVGSVMHGDLTGEGIERVRLQLFAARHNGRPTVVEELRALMADQPQEARIEWLVAALSQSITLVAEGLSKLDSFLGASRDLLTRGESVLPALALQPEIARLLRTLDPLQATLSQLAAAEVVRREAASRRAALRLRLIEVVTSKPFLHVASAMGGAAAVVFAKYLGLDIGD